MTGSSKSVSVEASDEGKVGHYVATLTLPQSGEWEWSIEAFGGTQPMPALTVVDASVAVTKSEPVTLKLELFIIAGRGSWSARCSWRIAGIAKESTLGRSLCGGRFTRQRSWICLGGRPAQGRSEE